MVHRVECTDISAVSFILSRTVFLKAYCSQAPGLTARKVQTSVPYSLTRGPVMEETKASSKKGKAGLSAGGAGPALAPKSLGRFSGARGRRMKAEPPNAAAGLRSKSPCPLSLISIYERVQRSQSEERLSRRVCMHTSRRHGTSLFAGRSARFSSRHSRHTTIVLLLFPPATDSQPPRLTLSPCSLERRTARFSGIRSVSSPTATSLFLRSSPFSPL